MTPDSASDFASEMYVAVVEEAPLWELPGGTTDLLSDGPVVHGPWAPTECAALITRWVKRGWVELYLPDLPSEWNLKTSGWQGRTERRGDYLVLARTDALELLQEPHRWTVNSADGQASLSKTVLGTSVAVSDWFAEAA
ncbi:MAG: hypothetical protein QOH29_974 [Actinomycetota bacterium]|jgi:hypothetical protein|nr:hypothetical protein [Actinomycetota bacterium]